MHDVLVKAWAMWGDYLENIFVKDRQLHLGVSAITCYLHACRHQNESKSRKYLAKVIREVGCWGGICMIILVGKTPCKMLIMATFLWLLVYLLIVSCQCFVCLIMKPATFLPKAMFCFFTTGSHFSFSSFLTSSTPYIIAANEKKAILFSTSQA